MNSTEPIVCEHCKELIKGNILTALDKTWHLEHFCCNKCKQPIQDSTFNTKEDMPYCTRCYQKLFLNTCNTCGDVIMGKHVEAMGFFWHEDHFLCQHCKLKLIGTEFVEMEGIPFCFKCYLAKHAPRCRACTKPINEKAIIALDAKWHEKCFKCSKCEQLILKDQAFKVDAGMPRCLTC